MSLVKRCTEGKFHRGPRFSKEESRLLPCESGSGDGQVCRCVTGTRVPSGLGEELGRGGFWYGSAGKTV